MNGIQIRPMRIEDYNEVIVLWRETEGIGLSDADTKEGILQFLERNPNLSYVAEKRNEIVGALLCGHDGRRGYLHHLAVRADNRKLGIGKKMVETCLENLKRLGITKCHLFVLSANEEGLRFWVHNGWTKRDDIYMASKNTE